MSERKAKFKEIILHWTGGVYTPNDLEKECYHYLIGPNGEVYKGFHKPEDNLDCKDNNYAPHCGGGNTGRIGIALCGMTGYSTTKRYSVCPITLKQVEEACRLTAELMLSKGIPVDKVRTHAEFGKDNPNTTSSGKIDIIHLPYSNVFGVERVGDILRNKVKWYYSKQSL